MTMPAPFRAALLSLCLMGASAVSAQPVPEPEIEAILDAAEALPALETVIVARDGEIIAERGYRGHGTDTPTNIKSASKAVVSALVGIAIDRGLIEGTDQPIADFLGDDFPENPDPRLQEITVGHLLSMQAGLERTSGANYGRWVASRNWVRTALNQPFVDEPGGTMLYSTGSTHLLSAILTRVGGQSTLALARDWLGPLDGFRITGWDRDPQGIYLGGNQMAMTPNALLAFGELYRNGGVTEEGERIVSQEWIDGSWTVRTRSRLARDDYGYGWYLRRVHGEDVAFAWGYGGQMLYIVPELALTVVMTSNENSPSASTGHRDRLHALLADIVFAVQNDDGLVSGQ